MAAGGGGRVLVPAGTYRTGTLYLWREDERRAEIGFHEGRIVSAWSPGHRRLGDLLTAAGVIDEPALESAEAFSP